MNEVFWKWFFRKVVVEEQIILPNLGTFSLCFESEKRYLIRYPVREKGPDMRFDDEGGYYFDGNSYRDVIQEKSHHIQARLRIRFRPTGRFRSDLKKLIILGERPEMHSHQYRWGGDRNPKMAVLTWGVKVKDPSKLSLHRRLIWSYHQDKQVSLSEAASQVSFSLNHFATSLMGYNNRENEPSVAHLTPNIFASVVYGRKASTKPDGKRGSLQYRSRYTKDGSIKIPRWRVRIMLPQKFLVSIFSEQNI